MAKEYDRKDPTARVAAGVKTALLVCVIGFIALAANRALVAPGGAPAAAMPTAPSIVAPDERTPALLPSDDSGIATRESSADRAAAEDDGADNHPPSF